MSDFTEKTNRLSPKGQKVTRMVAEASRSIYCEAEAHLLEVFRHTSDRPRDGFDSMVMVCSLARTIQALAVGPINLGPAYEKEHALLVLTIIAIGGGMESGLIQVSPDFPFSAQEMISSTMPHLDSTPTSCSQAIDGAFRRNAPLMLGMAAHLASAHPEEHAAFERLIGGDVGTIH